MTDTVPFDCKRSPLANHTSLKDIKGIKTLARGALSIVSNAFVGKHHQMREKPRKTP